MQAYIRVDSSLEIGTGHVMRCLTLAGNLRKRGVTVRFICREHVGHSADLIEENGFEVFLLPVFQINGNTQNHTQYSNWLGAPLMVDVYQTKEILKTGSTDLLIIDHYAIDEQWERKFRDVSKKIMVIDDLADRKHDCDVLIDQNYHEHSKRRYETLVPSSCKKFLGPSYALLREEFHEQWKKQIIREGSLKRILIFFGGIDQTNETGRAIESFLNLGRDDIQVDVVVGKSNPHIKELKTICQPYDHVHVYCQVSNIAELMGQADLSIGAGGSTTWERCYLSLPSIVWSVAENQVEICKGLGRKKLIKYLGEKEAIETNFITEQLAEMIRNETERHAMSQLSYQFMKGVWPSQQMMIDELIRLDD
ncbi:MAG: UDP-2,4-diacetamido-2,4,6-trideoxy-beta-L-altropyranose hydrolase [Peribacillus sp.]